MSVVYRGWVGGQEEVGGGWVQHLENIDSQAVCSVVGRNSHSWPRSYHELGWTLGADWHHMPPH